MNELHCGACKEKFEEMDDLTVHLKTCPAAEVLLPYINMLNFVGERMVGHPIGGLIGSINRNPHIINKYITAVATDMVSHKRAELHQELCEKLYLDYKTFKPFESSDIKTLPTVDEAKRIFWNAINEYLRSKI